MISKLQENTDYCYICGRYGMVVGLCYNHHRGNKGVHFNRELDLMLKKQAQEIFIKEYPDADFLAIYGKNYL